jgi:hypothetical protein
MIYMNCEKQDVVLGFSWEVPVILIAEIMNKSSTFISTFSCATWRLHKPLYVRKNCVPIGNSTFLCLQDGNYVLVPVYQTAASTWSNFRELAVMNDCLETDTAFGFNKFIIQLPDSAS